MLALELSTEIIESQVVDEYKRQLSNRRSLSSLCPESIEKRIGGNKILFIFYPWDRCRSFVGWELPLWSANVLYRIVNRVVIVVAPDSGYVLVGLLVEEFLKLNGQWKQRQRNDD